jgi:hypothetical protein
MSFKVTKLVVGKGTTQGDEKAERWVRRYYELEITIEDEHDIEVAKASVEGLIDGWLSASKEIEPTVASATAKTEKKQTFNMDKIKWIATEGASGLYEKSEDVSNSDFQELLKVLDKHQGKMRIGPFFVWKFESGQAIGRKKLSK